MNDFLPGLEPGAQSQVFLFDRWRIRVALIGNTPWFVAKDIAEALGYARFDSNLLLSIPETWKGKNPIRTPGGQQEVLALSLEGLFFFLNRSDKPAARPFQEWVNGKVLPSIHKTGGYSVPGAKTVKPRKCLAGAQLHELRMIYGPREAAKRIDYLIGFPTPGASPTDAGKANEAEAEQGFLALKSVAEGRKA